MTARTWGPTRLVRAASAVRPTNRKPGKHAPGAPRLPFAVLVTGLIVGGLGLLLLLNTASAANEVHRHDLAVRDAAVAAQLQQLRNDVAASAAPQNLAAAAAALGMVPAQNPAFLVVSRDGSVRVLGHPAPAARFGGAAQTPTTTPPDTATPTTKPNSSTDEPGSTATPTPTPTLTLPGGDR
jgi:hypothetical protein